MTDDVACGAVVVMMLIVACCQGSILDKTSSEDQRTDLEGPPKLAIHSSLRDSREGCADSGDKPRQRTHQRKRGILGDMAREMKNLRNPPSFVLAVTDQIRKIVKTSLSLYLICPFSVLAPFPLALLCLSYPMAPLDYDLILAEIYTDPSQGLPLPAPGPIYVSFDAVA